MTISLSVVVLTILLSDKSQLSGFFIYEKEQDKIIHAILTFLYFDLMKSNMELKYFILLHGMFNRTNINWAIKAVEPRYGTSHH